MTRTVQDVGAAGCAQQVRITIGRLRRRLRETQDRQDLTPSQISVLSRLDKAGPASASELAAAERVRPQSVATTLGVLVDRELVERRPDPGDGRRQLVSLTADGRHVLEDARRSGEEWLSRALAESLSPDELAEVAAAMTLLQRVADR